MDKLFTYDSLDMVKKLGDIEEEMREDSYHECVFDVESISENALSYIQIIFDYMKKCYRMEECTVISMMKEMYRIAATGEYMYIQEFDDIGYKNDVLEHMKGESGYQEVLYAIRLLRYYYLVKEKEFHSQEIWINIEKIYKSVEELGPLKKPEKKAKIPTERNELTEVEFMRAFRKHMDKYYIGQEVLKKKICSIIDLWKYHDVRTVFMMVGPSGSGKNYMIETIQNFPELGCPVVSYDCSSLTPNGFEGADVSAIFKKVRQSLRGKPILNWMENGFETDSKCIVFLDEIDKIINFNHDSRGESINGMIQQQLLSSLAGTEIIEGVDTSKILFILGGAFPRIDELKKEKGKNPVGFNSVMECQLDFKESLRDQIIAIGGEIEFVARIEDIVKMSKLTREDLKAILMDEQIGVFTKKKKVYQASGLNLDIEEDTINDILDLIVKEGAGARSVKNIMNEITDNQYFYDMKVGGYDTMKIHKGMLYGEAPIFLKGGKSDEKSVTYF